MRERRGWRWGLAFRVGLTLVVLGGIGFVVDTRVVARALGGANPLWLLLMYASLLTARVVDAYQLGLIMRRVGSPVGARRAFLANSLAALYSMILPGDIVAGGAKWASLSAASGEKARSLNAIVYNRVSLLVPPLFLGGLALVGESPPGSKVSGPLLGAAAGLVVGLTLLLYHPALGSPVERAALWVARPLPEGIAGRVSSVTTSLRAFRGFGAIEHASVVALSTLSTALSLGMFWSATQALGLEISIVSVVWIYAAIVVLRQLPLTVGGLGLREGFLVLVLDVYGVAAADAVGLGLLLFTNAMLWGIIGAGYQVALNAGWARWGSAGGAR